MFHLMLERRAEVERPVECGVTDVREIDRGNIHIGSTKQHLDAHS